MTRYIYKGAVAREFPTLGKTLQPNEIFEGPAGLTGKGISIASTEASAPKTAPAVPKASKEEVKEEPIQPSAPSDTTAGA